MNSRPVDVEIVTREHAILSASSAERWLVCTPSARIEEALADEESAYAADGTAAHAFAELRLRYLLKQATKAEYVAAYEAAKTLYAEIVERWEHSDWDSISEYVDYVLAEAERLEAEVHIEQRVDYSRYAQGGFGTSDALLVSRKHGTIKVIDLKFGKGVPVSALDNPQAKLYALGGVLMFDPTLTAQFPTIEWTIHQPRLNNVSTDSTSFDALIAWADDVVAPAAKLAWEGKGELKPTDKGCRFCKASATCRARIAENVLIARRDFDLNGDEPDFARLEDRTMTIEEIAKLLPVLDGWMQWARAVQDYALRAARDEGKDIPGFKLVRGRSVRRWAKSEEDVALLLKSQPDVSETALFEPPSLRSVAQMEKALGKKKFAELADSLELVAMSQGTPTLVPTTDPRPAIDAASEARSSFEAGSDK